MEEEESNTISLPPESEIRCETSCLRACLVAVSVFLWMEGAIFFLLGVFTYNFLKHFFAEGQGLRYGAGLPITSMVLGLVTVFIALLINYIIIYSSKRRFYLLSGVLGFIFIFEFVYFIAGVDYGSKVVRMVNQGFQTAMINFKDGFAFNMELNLIQWMLRCCGNKDYKDWFETTWADGRMEVPGSCCINVQQCHNLEPVMVDDIYQKGCQEKLRNVTYGFTAALISIVVFSSISQLLGVVLTLTLGVREEDRVKPRRRKVDRRIY